MNQNGTDHDRNQDPSARNYEHAWQDPSNPYNPYRTDPGPSGANSDQGQYQNQNPYQGQYQNPYQNPYGAYGYRPPYQNGYSYPHNRPPYYQGQGYYNPYYYQPPAWNDPMAAERRRKRREVRSTANWIGGATLLTIAFATVVSLLFRGIFMLLGTSGESIYEYALLYMVFSPVGVLLPYFIAAKAKKHKLSELVPFERHSASLGVGVILLGFLGILMGNVAADILATVFPFLSDTSYLTQTADPTNLPEYLIELLYSAAIPALMEEMAFRGIVLQMLRPWGDKFAIITSAAAFALIHGNFIQIPVTFFAGLFMGYAVVRTNNLWTSIVLHFTNNAMAVGLSALIAAFPNLNALWFNLVIYLVWALIGLAGLWILKKKNGVQGRDAGLKSYTGCLTVGQRTGAVLASPTVILSLIYYLGTAFLLPLMSRFSA